MKESQASDTQLSKSHAKGLPAPFASNYEWKDSANCKDADSEIFFLPYGSRAQDKKEREAKALAYCVDCTVVEQCLKFALDTEEYYGVWGGTTPEQRIAIIRQRRNGLAV